MICAVPVMKPDSSEARYTASAAISAALPTRPIGWRATNQASACANVCFGGPKRNRLFICATSSLYAIHLKVNGL